MKRNFYLKFRRRELQRSNKNQYEEVNRNTPIDNFFLFHSQCSDEQTSDAIENTVSC